MPSSTWRVSGSVYVSWKKLQQEGIAHLDLNVKKSAKCSGVDVEKEKDIKENIRQRSIWLIYLNFT